MAEGERLAVLGKIPDTRLKGGESITVMKVLYGALPRTSGYVTLDGHEVVTRSPQDGLGLEYPGLILSYVGYWQCSELPEHW